MRNKVILFYCLFWTCSITGQQQEHVSDTIDRPSQEQLLRFQETVKRIQKIKISGYIQTQIQWGEPNATLRVGSSNVNLDKSFNRIGIRRGRIKLAYEEKIASAVFQLDLTEKGVGIKDAYLNIKDPWVGSIQLKGGLFDRPFGNEISYSSSRREVPERSTIFQTLFPDERDLGVMLQLQPVQTSPFHFLKLEAGLFAGNGIKPETDNRKDFIGHLSGNKDIGDYFSLGGGISYYYGGVFQGTEHIYTIHGKSFIVDNNLEHIGKFAKREYFGVDLQASLTTVLGTSQLRAEYLFGQQPGNEFSHKSPNQSSLFATDTYIRNFCGGYVLFVQDLGKLPLSALFKYDWFDPNTQVSRDEIGLNRTTAVDLSKNTFGFGLLWKATDYLRLQAYYEINNNEKTIHLTDYTENRKDNVFTLRLQYKF
ncbi:hypothetical protein [Parabacteroides sp. PF5-9]|uniref:hypothetical protein n=1 Tax=Parabacteroides sp. PF5-9 TaxID=1742404 RepID=UPI002476D9C8|nr:hypothetical protein [Parabacteroides sp. PF5-9]MDH6356758.1 hypothetical protein [Parabacteroides sp. PF5-9]